MFSYLWDANNKHLLGHCASQTVKLASAAPTWWFLKRQEVLSDAFTIWCADCNLAAHFCSLGMVVFSHGTHARVHMNRDKHPETQCQSPVHLCSPWSNDPDYWGQLCLDPGVADVKLSLSFLSFGPVLVNTISQEWISSMLAQMVTYMITCWRLEVKIQLHWSITKPLQRHHHPILWCKRQH